MNLSGLFGLLAPKTAQGRGAVFLGWERLRIVYNLVLAFPIAWLVLGTSMLDAFGGPAVFRFIAVFLAAANVCYLLGATVEVCAVWLGMRSNVVRPLLFVAGSAFSVYMLGGLSFVFVMAQVP